MLAQGASTLCNGAKRVGLGLGPARPTAQQQVASRKPLAYLAGLHLQEKTCSPVSGSNLGSPSMPPFPAPFSGNSSLAPPLSRPEPPL